MLQIPIRCTAQSHLQTLETSMQSCEAHQRTWRFVMNIRLGCFLKRTAIPILVITAVLLLPLPVLAQDKAPAEATITGCLNKAATAGQYVIADEATKKNVIVTGDATLLDRHAANHKVTLTGAMTKEKDKEVFKATKLQMIAVCQ